MSKRSIIFQLKLDFWKCSFSTSLNFSFECKLFNKMLLTQSSFTALSGHIGPISQGSSDLTVYGSCQEYFFGCSNGKTYRNTHKYSEVWHHRSLCCVSAWRIMSKAYPLPFCWWLCVEYLMETHGRICSRHFKPRLVPLCGDQNSCPETL